MLGSRGVHVYVKGSPAHFLNPTWLSAGSFVIQVIMVSGGMILVASISEITGAPGAALQGEGVGVAPGKVTVSPSLLVPRPLSNSPMGGSSADGVGVGVKTSVGMGVGVGVGVGVPG